MKIIRSSYKDPSSNVFADEDGKRIFRTLSLSPENYNELNLFPKVLNHIENNIYEIEKIDFINFYYEWTFGQFKDSALFYLDILKELHQKKWALSDATPLNVTYKGNGSFIFYDHGSLKKSESGAWTAYLQFIREYMYPLIYLSNHSLDIPQLLLPFINNKHWQLQYKPEWNKRLSFKYQLLRSALLISTKKSLKDIPQSNEAKSNKGFLYNIEFFNDYIQSLHRKNELSRWGNYYSETVLEGEYVSQKTDTIIQYISQIKHVINTIVDFGASNGKLTSALAKSFNNISFIAIESDPIASAELYQCSKTNPIVPIYSNLLQLTPELGFNGSIDSLKSRISKISDLNLALGIIHHMMHEENLSFDHIIQYFHSLSKENAYLIIEYIGTEDPRYQLIRNVNYPYPEDIESFEESLKTLYNIGEKRKIHNDRYLFLAKKK
ncbi:MAG: hypothetical protein ACO29O_04880 [Chitinophagaceae bacterium]